MLHPRVQNLFRALDVVLSLSVLAYLESLKDLQYVFEFKGENMVGTLTIYHSLPTGPRVNVDHEWIKKQRVWFRRTAVQTFGADRYEAYIEYVDEYRDPVMVNLANPICWLEFEAGDPRPALFLPEKPETKKLAQTIRKSTLCPELF